MYCYNCMKQINDGSEFCFNCGKPVNSNHPPHHLKPGTILHNQYLVGNSIGEGGFGITYVGLDLSLDMKIAIKEFYPSGYANRNNTHSNNVTLNYQSEGEYFKSGVENFLREARSIAKFNNESSIVDVRAFFEENGTAYIIMEYLDGENLSDKIKRDGKFKSQEIFNLFLPMMGTLEKLHNENIIHRDISPENIRCMPDNTLKLMDFGSARYYAGIDKKTMSVQYKPGYAPFEQYNKNGNQGPWTDVYGLCATIYKCITGVTPVDSLERCQNDTLKKPSELGADITPSLEQVLMYGLGVYPENRCKSMSELADITRKALNNSNAVINSGDVAAGVVYGTQIADDQNKTMYADKTYGDSFTNQNKNGVNNDNYYKGGENNINRNQKNNQQNSSQIQKKKKKNYVPLIITLVVVAVIGFGVLGFFLFNNLIGNKTDDNSATSSQTEQAEQTEAPTLAAAVETEPDKDADLVTVPDVSGKKATEAANELGALGLKVETTYEENDEVPAECVIRQSIQPDRKLNKGNTVMLVFAKEPDNQTSVDYKPNNYVSDATTFTGASASSTLEDQQGYNYSPSNVLSNDSTCWVEGASGNGVDEWIKLELPSNQRVYDLRIVNGYAGSEKQYANNAKIKKIRIEFSNGDSTTADLKVFPTSQRNTVQVVSLSKPVVTDYVKITILDYEASVFEDTCLTYVAPN